MNKDISTLVPDIYGLFEGNQTFAEENITLFGQKLARHISNRITEERGPPRLRVSNLGTLCDRKLWYQINKPETAEKLPPQTRFKFLFGDILEELLLFLAAEAGHRVEGQQDEVDINGVKGHRDAVIDGHLVDVKSASTFSYRKFEAHDLRGNDAFGYLDQLNAYLYSSTSDPIVLDKDTASFLVVDKTLGNICLDTYPGDGVDYAAVVDEKRKMLERTSPPSRAYNAEPEGKSGNMKIPTYCSYCAHKHECWPGLRTFLYSSGPVHLTEVKRLPNVIEVDKDGNRVKVLEF